MAHFAEIGDNNIVKRVLTVDNSILLDSDGNEDPAKGASFLTGLFGGRWVQTSFNRNFRKFFAGEGYIYDEEYDVFYPPAPFPSWVLNTETFLWDAPVARTNFDIRQYWDEEAQAWVDDPIQIEQVQSIL